MIFCKFEPKFNCYSDNNDEMFRSACSIPLEDRMIITGGYYTKTIVSEYNQEGWVGDLASLNVGRYGHGCSSFVSGAERVRVAAHHHDIVTS